MNYRDLYTDQNFKYPEIAICMEDAAEQTVKLYIPAVSPLLEHDEPYDKIDPSPSMLNILNRETINLDIQKCTTSNYIEVKVPEYIESGSIKKGDKFVISFIGGNVNEPYILGRYQK